MTNFYTLQQNGSHDLIIKKSRFITSLKRVETEAEAIAFIQQIKKEHHTANHNCSAYLIGNHDQIQRASDDGEPAQTAGVPMLTTLKNLELKNVVAVVTRYFGGIKLGSGGLIRAYSKAVSTAVAELGIVARVEQQELTFTIPYKQVDALDYFLAQLGLTEITRDYGADVTYRIFVDVLDVARVSDQLTEQLQGQVDLVLGTTKFREVTIEKIQTQE